MSSVTTEELRSFHKIDRDLYFRLTVSLRRNAIQSMQVMALWLWIEQMGYPNIVYLMLPLSDPVVNAVAEEAILCLTCLESDSPPPSTIDDDYLPITSTLMNKEISLQFFYRNRFLVINGVTKTVNDVCLRAFEDIAKQALADAAAAVSLLYSGAVPPRFPSHPLFGVPQPSLLGTSPIPNIAQIFHLGQLNLEGETGDQQSGALFFNPTARPWSPGEEVPEVEQNEQETPQDSRTMFVTFSRGYPITEREVREFFTRNFGDCIETIIMAEVALGDQSLYARLIFYSLSQILDILNGRDKVKFVINGKHIWARLYVAKQGTSKQDCVPPPPPALPLPSTA